MVVWGWGLFSILFMNMIVTFLWHLQLLKIVPESAYIKEEAGVINMLISKGAGPSNMQIFPESVFPNYYLKFWNVKRMIFSRQEVNMSKYTEIIIFLFFFKYSFDYYCGSFRI